VARPYFDGGYRTWDDLAGDPAQAGPGAHTHEGRFRPATPEGGHTPVTWHMLAHHGVARRGPQPATLTIHADQSALAAWTVANLDAYWRPWLARCSPLVTPRGWFALSPYAAGWLVTGVSRLQYTLATGGITSEEGAARYALATFPPRWHRCAQEALRIRQADLAGSGVARALAAGMTDYVPSRGQPRRLYRTPLARRRDMLAFGDMVIADARRRYEATFG
jgi:hypothetical protein